MAASPKPREGPQGEQAATQPSSFRAADTSKRARRSVGAPVKRRDETAKDEGMEYFVVIEAPAARGPAERPPGPPRPPESVVRPPKQRQIDSP